MLRRLAQLLLSSEIGGFVENLPEISGFSIVEAVPEAWFVNQDLQNYNDLAYYKTRFLKSQKELGVQISIS